MSEFIEEDKEEDYLFYLEELNKISSGIDEICMQIKKIVIINAEIKITSIFMDYYTEEKDNINKEFLHYIKLKNDFYIERDKLLNILFNKINTIRKRIKEIIEQSFSDKIKNLYFNKYLLLDEIFLTFEL